MQPLDRFRHNVHFMVNAVRSSWSTRMLLGAALDAESLAMVTLQMFHYVKYTVDVTRYALGKLPGGAEHDEYRALLEYLAKDEAGHELVALADLERMGYDPALCRSTLPLPTTFNLPAENRFGVDEYGPYYLLGECYASEAVGAEIMSRIHTAYESKRELRGCLAFYELHGQSDVEHRARTDRCFERYVTVPGLDRPLLMGYLTALKNLMLLAAEIRNHQSYPAEFQLPSRRTPGSVAGR